MLILASKLLNSCVRYKRIEVLNPQRRSVRAFTRSHVSQCVSPKTLDVLSATLYNNCQDQFDDLSQAHDEVRWIAEALKKGPLPTDISGTDTERLRYSIEKLRIEKRMPLAYIIGRQPFGNLSKELYVRPPTLIPRAETADWVMQLIPYLKEKSRSSPLRILDLGCGSGCISLLLHENFNATIVGVDLSKDAVDLATENARLFEPGPRFFQLDMFDIATIMDKLGGPVDLIVSNPPYIRSDEFETLSPEVSKWEDTNALVGTVSNQDGLAYYRGLIKKWSPHVRLAFCMEVGLGQAKAVEGLYRASGWTDVTLWDDQINVPRCVVAWRRQPSSG